MATQPTLPPDQYDLHLPPQHVQQGQMARVVWSVMKLSSTTADFAWCELCKKWLRYNIKFNDTYIKHLFRHCKQQHVVSNGSLCSKSAVSQPVRSASAATSPVESLRQAPSHTPSPTTRALSAPQLSAPQPSTRPTSYPIPFYRTAQPAASLQQSSRQQGNAEFLRQGMLQYENARRQMAELSKSTAVPMAASSKPVRTIERYQQALAAKHQSIVAAQAQARARAQARAQAQAVNAARQAAAQRAIQQQHRQLSASAALQYSSSDQSLRIRQGHALAQQAAAQANVSQQLQRQATNVVAAAAVRGISAGAMATPVVTAKPTLPSSTPASRGVIQTQRPASTAAAGPGVRPTQPTATRPTQPTTARPMQSTAARPPQQHGVTSARLIRKKRVCRIVEPVRSIAKQAQEMMYRRSNLYFTEAVFQVPTTIEDAYEVMNRGTFDVDKEESSSESDLYYISWSNTQFFAARMAAIGFRFISCNLKKRPHLSEPVPVEQWLRLERYDSTARDRMQAKLGKKKVASQGVAGSNSSERRQTEAATKAAAASGGAAANGAVVGPAAAAATRAAALDVARTAGNGTGGEGVGNGVAGTARNAAGNGAPPATNGAGKERAQGKSGEEGGTPVREVNGHSRQSSGAQGSNHNSTVQTQGGECVIDLT